MTRIRLGAAVLLLAVCAFGAVSTVSAEDYGFAAKRPIMAGACPNCVWGPVAEVVKKIMAKRGWDVQVCYNCNEQLSPQFVANADIPHDLRPDEIELNDPPPPKGKVDFGVTNERLLNWAYHGTVNYVKDGPKKNLRLIASFEDPAYLIIAVDKKTGITDLSDIKAKKLKVRIMANATDYPIIPILEHYGIMPKDLESWGGKYVTRKEAMANGVDVIINRSGANGNNVEASVWNWASQTKDLAYLTLPEDLRARLVKDYGFTAVTLPRGYLKGVTAPIPTAELSGQAVIARDDMPEADAYTLAKALDEDRSEFLWSIRVFVSDPRKVWKSGDVPLHPGAARYYREVGYMK